MPATVPLTVTADNGERYVVHVLPLTSLARNGAAPGVKAVATVFVRKVEIDSKSCGALIARAFGLTPAELRVLLAIVEVGGVPETAAALGIAETTAKTHLHRVFSKTGTSRQAESCQTREAPGFPIRWRIRDALHFHQNGGSVLDSTSDLPFVGAAVDPGAS